LVLLHLLEQIPSCHCLCRCYCCSSPERWPASALVAAPLHRLLLLLLLLLLLPLLLLLLLLLLLPLLLNLL
jgi:hypothetical protein